jgi:hypothetical protein
MPQVQKVKLSYISLGDLRQRFSTQHQPLPPSWSEEVHDFDRYASTDDRKPLLIYGSDNRLLALRIRSKQPETVKKLAEAIDALSKQKKWDTKGIQRGHYVSQHFGVWCPYMPQPQVTAEHRHGRVAADDFTELAQPLFREMTAVLGGVAPDVFEEFQRHALPPDAQRACSA